jgi:hypothetical protein
MARWRLGTVRAATSHHHRRHLIRLRHLPHHLRFRRNYFLRHLLPILQLNRWRHLHFQRHRRQTSDRNWTPRSGQRHMVRPHRPAAASFICCTTRSTAIASSSFCGPDRIASAATPAPCCRCTHASPVHAQPCTDMHIRRSAPWRTRHKLSPNLLCGEDAVM